ncbi:hypothetical protein C8J56DRAFT_1049845 [Mycena floridula]|nr:hypothetical protein C8J56DRAFT_1049845 [Mycena floridula]
MSPASLNLSIQYPPHSPDTVEQAFSLDSSVPYTVIHAGNESIIISLSGRVTTCNLAFGVMRPSSAAASTAPLLFFPVNLVTTPEPLQAISETDESRFVQPGSPPPYDRRSISLEPRTAIQGGGRFPGRHLWVLTFAAFTATLLIGLMNLALPVTIIAVVVLDQVLNLQLLVAVGIDLLVIILVVHDIISQPRSTKRFWKTSAET